MKTIGKMKYSKIWGKILIFWMCRHFLVGVVAVLPCFRVIPLGKGFYERLFKDLVRGYLANTTTGSGIAA